MAKKNAVLVISFVLFLETIHGNLILIVKFRLTKFLNADHDGVMNHVSGKPIDHSEAEVQEAIQLLKTGKTVLDNKEIRNIISQ